jgi:predicted peptidase
VGQYIDSNIKDVLINILLFIVLVLLLVIPAYFCYKVFLVDTQTQDNGIEKIEEEQINNEEISQLEEIELGPTEPFYEFFPIIEDQQSYVVVPSKIDSSTPPTLILYSHGSNTTVTQNMEDPFMKDLREYGEYFSKQNYIFAASNQHGVNWGNEASLRDTLNLKTWVSENYFIDSKINLIGFSMGGLPTMNFAAQNPELVSKIALLAPTTRKSEWNSSRVEKILDIDIQIWHGNADVNVPYSSTVGFVNTLKSLGKDIPLITVEGKGHFDIDTEYMEDILTFFNS